MALIVSPVIEKFGFSNISYFTLIELLLFVRMLTVYTQDRAYLGAGCVSNTGEPALKGAIDKFQVYNSALTANQVYTLYYKK